MPLWGQDSFYSLYMHLGIFPAGAMAQVNAELKHIEAVGHDILSEFGVNLPVFFGFSRQVKKYEYPHDAICVESLKHALTPQPLSTEWRGEKFIEIRDIIFFLLCLQNIWQGMRWFFVQHSSAGFSFLQLLHPLRVFRAIIFSWKGSFPGIFHWCG